MTINESAGYNTLIFSPSLTTALTPHIGYHKAAEIAALMKEKKMDIFEANDIMKAIDDTKLKKILQPGNLLKLGFSLDDLNHIPFISVVFSVASVSLCDSSFLLHRVTPRERSVAQRNLDLI